MAKNIPGEYVLYVKEHYARLGHRDTDFYKKLKKFPNVRLINPWIDSQDLLNKSVGVIVLTSTLGWEALMCNKPVFILGNVFYETFKYSIKIDNITKLSKIIKTNIDDNKVDEIDYEHEFLKYFTAYLKSMHNGNYILSDNTIHTEENVIMLTEALCKELEN